MSYHALVLWRVDGAEFCRQLDASDQVTLRALIEKQREAREDCEGFDVDAWQDTPDGRRNLNVREHAGTPMRALRNMGGNE